MRKKLMVKKKEKNKQEARSGKKQYYTDYFNKTKQINGDMYFLPLRWFLAHLVVKIVGQDLVEIFAALLMLIQIL